MSDLNNKNQDQLEVTMPLEVAQAALAAMKKVFMDWDVLNEKPPEFLKHMQDLTYCVEQVGGWGVKQAEDIQTIDMFGFADIQEPENSMDRVPWYARNFAKGPEFYLKTEGEQLEIIERIKARILSAMTDEWAFIDFDYYEGYRFLCPFLYMELQKEGKLQCRRYYWGKCDIDYMPDDCDVLSGEHDPLGSDCGYTNQYRLAGGAA